MPPKSGPTSKNNDSYTLSAVFEEAQAFQKCLKMDARMESLGIENHKNPPHTELQKRGQIIRL